MNQLTPMTLTSSIDLFEIKPGRKFSEETLKSLLTNVEDVLFFGKLFDLNQHQLGKLMQLTLRSDVLEELLNGSHSTDLQDYLVLYIDQTVSGQISFDKNAPKGEILPQMWEDLEVQIATSIQQVAEKLAGVIDSMPGKQGKMVFQSMLTLNKRRPTVGDFKALIKHEHRPDNLIIFDVSGSMSESTVRKIVDDVVALSYKANAHLAIISNTCTVWGPGEYNSDVVLQAAEFGGTQYENLSDLLNRDWGVVVTIADYDSSLDAKRVLANCTGSIDTVLDVSLVNQPTFLAQCVGQLANEVRPLLIGNSQFVLH